MRLTRGQRTLRNGLLCLLLGALVYAMLGFPPCTVRGMLDRVERQYLLTDLEPVLAERYSWRYSGDMFAHRSTYLIARTGDTYVSTEFTRHGLAVRPESRRGLKMERGALCMALDGMLYAAGDFAEAAAASAEVTAERTTRMYDPDTEKYELVVGEKKTFSYEGEKVSDAVFSFCYREEGQGTPGVPGSDFSLEGTARNWYSGYIRGDPDRGRGILHGDLPVKVTLYDAEGQVLDTLELSVDNYEIFWT